MPRFTYADAGVDRNLRARSKKALHVLKRTHSQSRYGDVVQLPYGNIFPYRDHYLDLAIEGVGTKVLIAQLAEKYDTIAIDGIAMVLNDIIRSGARPIALADNIHTQISNPELINELMKGIVKAASESGCIVPSGEIGDVADLIKGIKEGTGFDMVFASIGEVNREKIISGRNITPGDVVIGLRSSGVHSNGISLVRRILFKSWGGKFEPHVVPDKLDEELVHEVLKPTKIYVKPLLEVVERLRLKAAVHITGDAYLKFGRLEQFSKGIGFQFDNFHPQTIFELIQKTATDLGRAITDEEMFKTFNMGWGFAVVVGSEDAERALSILEKTAESEKIGQVTDNGRIEILYAGNKIVLS
jgi:phosphoribosylformylglycinamidine cyclo-ligase